MSDKPLGSPVASMTKKDPAPYKLLKEGDSFTIIEKLPVLREDETPVDVGDIIVKWFDTGESGRKFRVTKVHAPATYETVFVGFETFEVKQ